MVQIGYRPHADLPNLIHFGGYVSSPKNRGPKIVLLVAGLFLVVVVLLKFFR